MINPAQRIDRRTLMATACAAVAVPRMARAQTPVTTPADALMLDDDWSIDWQTRHVITADVSTRWEAMITNRGSERRNVPVVGVRFADAGGGELGTTYALPFPPVLDAGESGFLRGFERMIPAWAAVDLSLCETEDPEDYLGPNDELDIHAEIVDEVFDAANYTGTITIVNRGDADVERLAVVVEFLDSAQRIVGVHLRWLPDTLAAQAETVLGVWTMGWQTVGDGVDWTALTTRVWTGYCPYLRTIACS